MDSYQGTDRSFAKAIEATIREMFWAESIKVNGRTIPQGVVRGVLDSMTIDHVDHIMAALEGMDPEDRVTNGRAYLMACIYNAPADCAVNSKRAYGR